MEKFWGDPHWYDHIFFYENFLGDNGSGLGISHQTGRIGLVAKIIQLYYQLHPKRFLCRQKKQGSFKAAEVKKDKNFQSTT
jgi:hypothetical protein